MAGINVVSDPITLVVPASSAAGIIPVTNALRSGVIIYNSGANDVYAACQVLGATALTVTQITTGTLSSYKIPTGITARIPVGGDTSIKVAGLIAGTLSYQDYL